jgi:hypothetical protein
MSTPDPTPTPLPAAPDWRALLEEMTRSLSLLDKPPHDLLARAQAFLAATREAGPLPQAGAEISDEEVDEMAWAAGMGPMDGKDDDVPRMYWEAWDYQLRNFARAVLARWGGAAVPVPVSERPWERDGWCDTEGHCWRFDPCENGWWSYGAPLDLMGSPSPWTHMAPHWALPVPAAAAGDC